MNIAVIGTGYGRKDSIMVWRIRTNKWDKISGSNGSYNPEGVHGEIK